MKLISFILCVLFLIVLAANSTSDFTDGKKAQLSKEQMQELVSKKAVIAVPTYIPVGFILKKVQSSEVPTDNYIAVDYSLLYQNSMGKKFKFQASNDGLGDIQINHELKSENSTLDGPISVGHFDDKTSVAAQWIKAKKKFQPADIKNPISYSLIAEDKALSTMQVRKIMESLRILKK